jgi:hypothetical protein
MCVCERLSCGIMSVTTTTTMTNHHKQPTHTNPLNHQTVQLYYYREPS